MTANILAVAAIVVAVVGPVLVFIVNRRAGKDTTVHNEMTRMQGEISRADARAKEAEQGLGEARDEITEMWTQVRAMQTTVGELQQQLDWSKAHIHVLRDHINRELGPPAPPLPAGLHWSSAPGG